MSRECGRLASAILFETSLFEIAPLKFDVKQHQGVVPAIIISTLIAGLGIGYVWQGDPNTDAQMTRFGQGLSQTLANTSAGPLLHSDRIELTVIATDVVRLPEVAGIIFYNVKNEILAVNGSSDRGPHFTAPATLDDTITGYVSVILLPEAFESPVSIWRWLVSLALLVIAPLVGVASLIFADRGNRSLPIVSVPELLPKECYCVAITLHNQMALSRTECQQAISDAHTMAIEASATDQGMCIEAAPRGVVLLFDLDVGADQVAACTALTLKLLKHFETAGDFRAAVGQTEVLGSVKEQVSFAIADLDNALLDNLFTLGALSKPGTMLLSEPVYQALETPQKTIATSYTHPLVEDLFSNGAYEISTLTEGHNRWVDEQAQLILGFTQQQQTN